MQENMEMMSPDPNLEQIKRLIQSKNIIKLRELFEYYNNVDLAECLSECSLEEILFIFKTMKPLYTSEIFSYFDHVLSTKLIEVMSSGEITCLLDNLMSDDVVDFLEELPTDLVQEVLKYASKEKRNYINQLLNLKPETAGSLMGVEFLTLTEEDTVKTALDKIKKEGKNAETINYIYVIDARKKFAGSLRLKDIIISTEETKIIDIMETDLISVNINLNQEEVAKIFKEYGFSAIPVTNQDNYLVGIITIDDIIDVMEEEATEDMQKMAGIVPLEESYLQTSVISHTYRRVSWISILMILAVFTGLLIDSYQDSILVALPLLSAFIPMLMNVGGVAGGQTTTLIIRSMALNEIKVYDAFKVLFKELRASLLIGLFLAVINFIWLVIQIQIGITLINYSTAILVCTSLFLVVLAANLIGVLLPIFAKMLRLDPALFASPLLTNIADILAIIIYFSLAILFKQYL